MAKIAALTVSAQRAGWIWLIKRANCQNSMFCVYKLQLHTSGKNCRLTVAEAFAVALPFTCFTGPAYQFAAMGLPGYLWANSSPFTWEWVRMVVIDYQKLRCQDKLALSLLLRLQATDKCCSLPNADQQLCIKLALKQTYQFTLTTFYQSHQQEIPLFTSFVGL